MDDNNVVYLNNRGVVGERRTHPRIWNQIRYWFNPVNIVRRLFSIGRASIDMEWERVNYPNPLVTLWDTLCRAVRKLFSWLP